MTQPYKKQPQPPLAPETREEMPIPKLFMATLLSLTFILVVFILLLALF